MCLGEQFITKYSFEFLHKYNNNIIKIQQPDKGQVFDNDQYT